MTNQRGSSHLPIILALFFGAAVVVLIFGYMLWPKDEEITSTSTIDTNKVVATNAANQNANATNENVNATADATKDWKMYTNSTYGFSLKHPKEWQVKEENVKTSAGSYDNVSLFVKVVPENPSAGNTSPRMTISVYKQTGNETAVQTYQRFQPTDLSQTPKVKTRKIDGVDADEYQAWPGFVATPAVLFAHKGNTYLINVFELATEFENVLNTINLPDSTTGWKTYENVTWGFSFKYPKEWSVLKDNLQRTGTAGSASNIVRVGTGDLIRFEFWVDPAGFSTWNVYKKLTIEKRNEKFIVTKEEPTNGRVGEFGLTKYYSLRAVESENAKSPRFFIRMESDVVSFNDAITDILFKNILSTFTFTK